MRQHRTALPSCALKYLQEVPTHHAERIVVMLHGWLFRTNRILSHLTVEDIKAFLEKPCRKPISQRTRCAYRHHLRKYLTWLEARGLCGPFEQRQIQGYHRKVLPEEASRFLRYLEPIRQPGTVRLYRSVLLRFHEWFDQQGALLQVLERGHCLAWAQHLHDRKLHPATRVCHLGAARKYLDWLWEQGICQAPGYTMILAKDLPKKPEYLPRPLPPSTDQALQTRLRQADTAVALGLFVMRRTGMRVGELRTLERGCIRIDPAGQCFLKVPLGKLHTERLVPLDSATLEVVEELQRRARPISKWLIEGARERPVSAEKYQSTLKLVGAGLETHERLTTHRLRHTFATALMNAGMSLMGIMKLLGHQDYRMTLRYTAIADETVGREYFEALSRLAERYEGALTSEGHVGAVEPDPLMMMQDVIRWANKHLRDPQHERRARLLIQRLERVRDALALLTTELS